MEQRKVQLSICGETVPAEIKSEFLDKAGRKMVLAKLGPGQYYKLLASRILSEPAKGQEGEDALMND